MIINSVKHHQSAPVNTKIMKSNEIGILCGETSSLTRFSYCIFLEKVYNICWVNPMMWPY